MKIMMPFTCLLFVMTAVAQNGPVNFEADGEGANYTWTVFENDTNPPLEIVDNPDPSGINTSSKVAQFTALVTGAPFAGTETMHGSDIGTFTLTAANAFVKMKVYKSVISDVGFKFATPEGASTGEILVSNTVINAWEELTFDFTGVIGEPSSNGIDQIIVFPDFQDRGADTVSYFDDITFGDGTLAVTRNELDRVSAFPNPATQLWNVNAQSSIQHLRFFTILGQQVLELEPNADHVSVDVSSLANGLYVVRIVTAVGESNVKFLKE